MMRRRNFLISGTAGFAASTGLVLGKNPSIPFPAEPRSRLAVASYPFRDQIQSAKQPADPSANRMPLTAFPAMVVERFRVRHIEPLSDHFPSTSRQYLQELQAAVEKAGVTIVNIPVSLRGSLYDPAEKARLAAIEEAKHWIDVAAALQSPSVRIHIEGARGVQPDVERTAASFKAIVDHARRRNIVVNLENDDPATEDAFFLVQVMDRVADPYLRGLPDFCNSMLIGNGERNYDAVRAMFRHAYNISHVKDSEVDGQKIYRVDVARTFRIAKESGYRGFFSMEWEGGGDPYAGTSKLIDLSLKNLA